MKKLLFIICCIVILYIIKKMMKTNKLKIHIYHMPNCKHCYNLMYNADKGKTQYAQIVDAYKTNPQIEIKDFLYGRDSEADKYNAFPVILFTKDNKEIEYHGPHTADKIIEAANKLL